MSRPDFSGVWAPLLTPFHHGAIDHAAAMDHAQHLLDAHIQGLVVAGTTGEGYALRTTERRDLLDTVLAVSRGRTPVLLGLEGAATAPVTEIAYSFRHSDVAGFLVSAPAYVRPTAEGLYRHYMTVAEAAGKPVVIYNVPGRTGVTLSQALVARLFAQGAFPAIKACGQTIESLQSLIDIDGLQVMAGDDDGFFLTQQMGGTGGILASANLLPDRFVDIYTQLKSNRQDEAWQRFERIRPLIRLLFSEPNPGPVKTALSLMGLMSGEVRLPLVPMRPEKRHALRHAMLAAGVLTHAEERPYVHKPWARTKAC